MKKTIGYYEFRDEFMEVRPNNFSYEGLQALWDYLEMLENDLGEELELDVIALCCDFTEYVNIEEFQGEYGEEYESLEDIEEHTTVIPIEGTERFIIQAF